MNEGKIPKKEIIFSTNFSLFRMMTMSVSNSLEYDVDDEGNKGWWYEFWKNQYSLALSMRGRMSFDRKLRELISLIQSAQMDSASAWAAVLSDPPTTLPVNTNRYQFPFEDSSRISVIGSNCNPVSSTTSRLTAAIKDSPGSTRPAGRYHVPAHVDLASCIISTSFLELNTTAATMYVTLFLQIGR